MDSVALLLLLKEYFGAEFVTAIHVNHGLSAQAANWESFCRELCATAGVGFLSERVTVPPQQRQQSGLEAAARNQRYTAFARHVPSNGALFTAHHQDDQLETILLRLERGVDLLGLPAMRGLQETDVGGQRIRVYRPLLGVSKADLRAYLQARGQRWVEDDSNADHRLRRNYIRQCVVPALSPSIQQQLLDMAELAGQVEPVLQARLAQMGASPGAERFELKDTLADFPMLAKLALKRWLRERSVGLPKARLDEALRQLRLGTGAGLSPFYSSADYDIYIRRRCLTVVKNPAK